MKRSTVRIAATFATTSVLVLAGLVSATPAFAAPVGSYADLETAFGASGTVELTSSIASPSSELVLANGATQVLNLGAFNLGVHSIVLGSGSSLTITGTTGVLTADASDLDPGGFYWDARAGITVPNDATLVISSGTVHATGGGQGAAGIGAQSHGSLFIGPGSITISGGTVVAVGSVLGAGIGGSAFYPTGSGSISISGGNVTATGGSNAAGIGGGGYSHVNSITISGGTVNATGSNGGAGIGGGEGGGGAGTISISAGTITATSADGAAIGSGGYTGLGSPGTGSITITGGTITADSSAGDGAGIGSGYSNSSIAVTISNASITATSDTGAGIGGGGWIGTNGLVTINSGTFTIHSASGAGIGSGGFSGPADPIVINGGTFSITADSGGAAIGGGFLTGSSSISINGGTLTLVSETLAPVIGSGVAGGSGGTITIANGVIVSVSTDQAQTVVGGTNGSATITLNGRLTILEGGLIAPTTGGLTIGSTGVLRGPGSLSGASPILNNGSITGSVVVTATDVQVNNYLVTYSPDAGVGYAGGTQRVYATSFTRAELPLADPVAGYDVQWFTAPVAGALFTTTTPIASNITLYPAFSVSALSNTGTDSIGLLPIALIVLLLGGGLLVLRRRAVA